MPHPDNLPGTRLCIALTSDGVTLYGNASALKSLARQLDWIAEADPKEHFECHVGLHMSDDESVFGNKTPRNITVLVARDLSPHISKRGELVKIDGDDFETRGFDVTFMAVTETELNEMAQHEDSGLLPDRWNSQSK